MWRVASSIPLNGFILFFIVFAIFALLGTFKLRADHAPDRKMGVRPITITLAAAALCSFVTCFALNYSSLNHTPEAPPAVEDDKTYRVYDMEKGGTEDITGRDVKVRYGSDVREDGTRARDENRRTFGEELNQIRHNRVQPDAGSAAPKLVP